MAKKRITIICVLAATCAAVSTAAAGHEHRAGDDDRLVFGVRVDFTSATEAAGTFAVCCAVDDAGAAHARVTAFVPRPGNRADFRATETLEGAHGTITLALSGTTGPLDRDRHIARGSWAVSEGTGAYGSLSGSGRFTALTDEITGALTAVNRGEIGE